MLKGKRIFRTTSIAVQKEFLGGFVTADVDEFAARHIFGVEDVF